ncbi:CPBP family intramembrane glutamic endopeptidase [Spiroplasma apis]|uniref:CAAX amino terminal membrane bound protease n=1 Tax=Spiroplasma apis B31 TaxID=1276258 RepID=V5RH11_SPIAP|nr:type II CAAX endopeptidase family protein [Spiroplasma apis]AHB35952.1 CAAX amino terminal membrane bound protease [Spiroplasma apis B31]
MSNVKIHPKNKKNKQLDFKSWQDKHFSTNHNFKFDILNWKTDGMIFASSALFVPLLLSIIFTIFFNLQSSVNVQATLQILTLISVGVGFIFNYMRNGSGFWKNGYGWFYIYTFLQPVLALLLSIFLLSIPNSDDIKSFLTIGLYIVSTTILVILVMTKDRTIFKRIKETLKTQKVKLLLVTFVGIVLILAICQGIFVYLYNWIFNIKGESNNQESLIGPLKNKNTPTITKVIYLSILFIYVVLLAPICEEIVTRNCWFLNVSNKWFAYITSSIYFGFLHFGFTGDYIHSLSYISSGFILGGAFILTKGNVTYSWMLHLTNNLISFILILVSIFI